MGLLEITLLAALVVAAAAGGRILYMRNLVTKARDAAESTLKEMLGDPKYSERSFDVLSMCIESEDDEETREMLREIGAEQIEEEGGRELWTMPSGGAAPSDKSDGEKMPSA